MNKIIVVIPLKKETKNTWHYGLTDSDGPVREIYIQKSHFAPSATPPAQVTVTVEG